MHAGRGPGGGGGRLLLLLLLLFKRAALYLLLLLLGEPATKCFSSFLVSLSLYIFSLSSSLLSLLLLLFLLHPHRFPSPLRSVWLLSFFSSLVFFFFWGRGAGGGGEGYFSPYFPCLESLVVSFAIGLFLLLLLVFFPPWCYIAFTFSFCFSRLGWRGGGEGVLALDRLGLGGWILLVRTLL